MVSSRSRRRPKCMAVGLPSLVNSNFNSMAKTTPLTLQNSSLITCVMHVKPYYSIGDFYKKRFGEKVYKISVSVADTCPNRLGMKGMQTCIFCDVWGSSAYPEVRDQNLSEQINGLL